MGIIYLNKAIHVYSTVPHRSACSLLPQNGEIWSGLGVLTYAWSLGSSPRAHVEVQVRLMSRFCGEILRKAPKFSFVLVRKSMVAVTWSSPAPPGCAELAEKRSAIGQLMTNREIIEQLCLVRFFFLWYWENWVGVGMLNFTINKVNLSITANQESKILAQGKC